MMLTDNIPVPYLINLKIVLTYEKVLQVLIMDGKGTGVVLDDIIH